jgi:hypothetical protein
MMNVMNEFKRKEERKKKKRREKGFIDTETPQGKQRER